MYADVLDRRITYSLLVSLIFHFSVLWFFGFMNYKEKNELKVITNIDFVEPVIPGAPPGPKEEAPKNLWEFVKMALPTLKKPDFPENKKEDKPVDVVKKELEKMRDVERKLVDKQDPLKRKQDALKFKDLERESDQKLADLKKLMKNDPNRIKELMEQEKKIVDRVEPLARATEPALKFDEVGKKRVENVKDVFSAEKNPGKEERELTPADLLTEKRTPIDKKPKADDFGIKLISKEPPKDTAIKEIIGTKEERKMVRELLAIQQQLKDKEPARVAGGSGGGGGGGGGKPRIGYGGGGSINIERNQELKKPEKKEISESIKKDTKVEQTAVVAVKQSEVELAGPLKDRKIKESFMPKYPEWMKEKGIEADVAVLFKVSPQGVVRDKMNIELTSGYTELDRLVMTVLKTWSFEPLSAGVLQEDQWGIVTFRFRLKY